jgi:dimethylaniline monooxygenase (N-oxide forming)
VLPAQYRLSGRHARPDIALGTLAEVAVLFGQDVFGQEVFDHEGAGRLQED